MPTADIGVMELYLIYERQFRFRSRLRSALPQPRNPRVWVSPSRSIQTTFQYADPFLSGRTTPKAKGAGTPPGVSMLPRGGPSRPVRRFPSARNILREAEARMRAVHKSEPEYRSSEYTLR